MRVIKNRHGQTVELTLYGGDGRPSGLTPARLETALRLRQALRQKQALPGAPDYFARSFEKISGLIPVKMGLKLWNGKSFFLNVPSDTANFVNDIDGIILRDQYDAAGSRGKIVVDAGANIGIFSLYARALGAKKIYAFEAVRETFAILKRNLALNRADGKIEAKCAALGEKKGDAELLYGLSGEGSSMIDRGEGDRGLNFAGHRRVKVRPLDALLGKRIDFLKMDVEGYEKNVLLGAAGLIKKYKPALSFSAYHRKNDRTELPKTVLGIRNDYRIRYNVFAEQTFYCD